MNVQHPYLSNLFARIRRRGPFKAHEIAVFVAALSAAYVWSTGQKSDPAEALRWGVAAGTASARLPGMGFASLEQSREIYAHVEMRRAD